MRAHLKSIAVLAAAAGLSWGFWASGGLLQLCAGLALFLFGMQCLEDGLRVLAGGRLELLLTRSTETPAKGLLFGVGATILLQSSTLVSLLTIAFLSTGLVQLAGAVAIVFGANLGATSGIWLLALAGQNLSLSPVALPLLVFGVLAGVLGARGKAAGRVAIGVAFVFLGIDALKTGFEAVGGSVDLTQYHVHGVLGQLVFTGLGLAMTIVLQSSHASLMLTLAALAGGQIELHQGFAIAIGSNVGSSVSTAVVGMLGSNRSGQRLALAHVVFNGTTALLASLLLVPMAWLVRAAFLPFGLQDNALVQLALFHTLFNALGVALFWPWQARLAALLLRLLPEQDEPAVLIAELGRANGPPPRAHARYLSSSALATADSAAMAAAQELQHLGRLSVEVICHALYVPVGQLESEQVDEALLQAPPREDALSAEDLYQRHVKGVYGDLLAFMGRLDVPLDDAHRQFWNRCQLAALQLVEAVKDAKHLQKNLGFYLRSGPSEARDAYLALRRHLLEVLRTLRQAAHHEPDAVPASPQHDDERLSQWLERLDRQAQEFDAAFRERLFEAVRRQRLDGLVLGSLMNDLGYANSIVKSLRGVLSIAQGQEPLRGLQRLVGDEPPMIVLP